MATPIDVVLFTCRKICPTKSVKSCVIYLTKNPQNFGCLSNCRYCARASPQQFAHSAPDFIQIGSLSAELQPNAWIPFFCHVEYFHDSPEAICIASGNNNKWSKNFDERPRLWLVTPRGANGFVRPWSPSNKRCLGPTWLNPLKCMWIGLAVFEWLTNVNNRQTDRQTDHATPSVAIACISCNICDAA